MLSNFSFNDFFSKYNLKTVEDQRLFLMALLSFKKLNTTQIHKLSFLTFAENNAIIPFEFIKMPHGPFSENLRDVLDTAHNQGLILKEENVYKDYNENLWSLSDEGKNLVSSDKLKIDEIKDILKLILETYLESSAKSLERYCYNNYLLKSASENQEEWELRIKTTIDNLQTLLNNRIRDLQSINELEESTRDVVLACFDYIENLLRKLSTDSGIDQVIKGVLIKKVGDYINLWGEILNLSRENGNEPRLNKLLKDSKELFNFINISSERYHVFDSIF